MFYMFPHVLSVVQLSDELMHAFLPFWFGWITVTEDKHITTVGEMN